MNNSGVTNDDHDTLTPLWISRAHSAWNQGEYGVCRDTLIENSIIRLNLYEGDNAMFSIDTNGLDKPHNKKSGDTKSKQPTPYEQSFNSHRDRGYALTHNILLSHYLHKGVPLHVQLKDGEQEGRGKDVRFNEAVDGTAPLKNYLYQFGKVSMTSAYNLAFTHFMTGNYVKCSKACEDIFNQINSNNAKDYDTKVHIHTAYLYIHSQLMIGDVNNQKIQDMIGYLEKTVLNLVETTGEQLKTWEDSKEKDSEKRKLIRGMSNRF